MKKLINIISILLIIFLINVALGLYTVKASEENRNAKDLISIMNENFIKDERVVVLPVKQILGDSEEQSNIYFIQENVHLASIIKELKEKSSIDENYEYYDEIRSSLQGKLFAHIALHIEKPAGVEKLELIASDEYNTDLLKSTGFNFVERLEDGSYNITIEVAFKDLSAEKWYIGSQIGVFNVPLTLKGYKNEEDTEPSYESQVTLVPVDDTELPESPDETMNFKDVSKNVWYYNSVKYCYENGIIMGTTDETFSPNTNVTRGNLVTILWRMEGNPVVSGNLSFPDVKQSDYYYEAVKWAEKTGVVHGYDTGKFGPNNYISREQLATILNNYAKYKKKDTSRKADLSTFTDNKKISSYAKEGVAWAVGNKVMSGKNEGTRVDPQGKATRAETAAMIQNYCNYVGR